MDIEGIYPETAQEGRTRNPVWSRDELILALDLYLKNRESPPGKTNPMVVELSQLLNIMGRRVEDRQEDFRNPSGVYMKMMNFRSLDPIFTASGKKGLTSIGEGDRVVWRQFSEKPEELSAAAEAIRANVSSAKDVALVDLDGAVAEAEEGRLLTRQHIQRERSRSLVEKKKAAVLKTTGRLECEACGFDFEVIYGERGKGFIEAHHTKPLNTLTPGTKTSTDDLVVLCANCHRMVHSRRPWLSIVDLRLMVRKGS